MTIKQEMRAVACSSCNGAGHINIPLLVDTGKRFACLGKLQALVCGTCGGSGVKLIPILVERRVYFG